MTVAQDNTGYHGLPKADAPYTGPVPTSSQPAVASFGRGLAILDLIRTSGRIRATAIVDRLGIPESTVYRYCRKLREDGFIIEVDGFLLPSYKLSEANDDHQRHIVTRLARPILTRLAAQTSLAALLTMRVHTAAMCVDNITAPGSRLVASHHRGTIFSLHSGATATPLLAWAPRDVTERVLSGNLRRYTTHTPDAATLRDEITQLRLDGYHVTSGWLDPGLAAIGVPVIRDDVCRYALSLVGTLDSLTRVDTNRALLVTAAAELARELPRGVQ